MVRSLKAEVIATASWEHVSPRNISKSTAKPRPDVVHVSCTSPGKMISRMLDVP